MFTATEFIDLQPHMEFAVCDCRRVSAPLGCLGELWAARIKACRHGLSCEVFDAVYFYELNGIAFVVGTESKRGVQIGLSPVEASKQRNFIKYLRNQTYRESKAMGPLASIFSGPGCSSEARATASYVAQRVVRLKMGVGCFVTPEHYEVATIDPRSLMVGSREPGQSCPSTNSAQS